MVIARKYLHSETEAQLLLVHGYLECVEQYRFIQSLWISNTPNLFSWNMSGQRVLYIETSKLSARRLQHFATSEIWSDESMDFTNIFHRPRQIVSICKCHGTWVCSVPSKLDKRFQCTRFRGYQYRPVPIRAALSVRFTKLVFPNNTCCYDWRNLSHDMHQLKLLKARIILL